MKSYSNGIASLKNIISLQEVDFRLFCYVGHGAFDTFDPRPSIGFGTWVFPYMLVAHGLWRS